MNYAVIFAGGSGQRMKSKGIPKQFLKLNGVEIIIRTLQLFENNRNIDAISVVCIEPWIQHLDELLVKYSIKKVKWINVGGQTGQESIYNGLTQVAKVAQSDDIVLIHDGVRPFVNDELIDECIKVAKNKGSAITVTGAIETITTLKEDGSINTIMDRSVCYLAKAPQAFLIKNLMDAHHRAIDDKRFDFIDSASIMKFYGYPLYTVQGNTENIKITTPADYYIAEALLKELENKSIFGV